MLSCGGGGGGYGGYDDDWTSVDLDTTVGTTTEDVLDSDIEMPDVLVDGLNDDDMTDAMAGIPPEFNHNVIGAIAGVQVVNLED